MIWIIDFDEGSLKRFCTDFFRLEADSNVSAIDIFINSGGGEVSCMLGMRDLIKSAKKPVSTTIIGRAYSCAVPIAASGTKGLRFAAPSASVMMHETSGQTFMLKNSEFMATAEQFNKVNELILTNMSLDMGRDKNWLTEKFSSRKNTDWYMTADEAKSIGIVDHVGLTRPTPVKPSKEIYD